MRLDLYQTETAMIAQEQSALLDEARVLELVREGQYLFVTDFLVNKLNTGK